MEPRVKRVKTRRDHTLVLTFNNGEVRNFDMTPYLNRGVFRLLKDWNRFRRAKVMFGTVVWPDDVDVAPETLYLESVPQRSVIKTFAPSGEPAPETTVHYSVEAKREAP